ncbi:MAG: phage minor head protein [Pyrinomonadaceae bacterium]
MSDLYEMAEGWKARLLSRERRAAGDLLRAYRLAAARVEARVRDLTVRIDETRRQGQEVGAGWLHERDRLTNLRREIIAEIGRFSEVASLSVARAQAAARALGAEAARELIGEAGDAPVGIRLGVFSAQASAAIAGFAADGSPLRQLFAEQSVSVARRVADELVAGVAQGSGARVVASRIRGVLGGELSRALTIARTETVRAYREATRETYITNASVLRGWYWQAALGPRTCGMCLAMHGRVFPVEARLESHPNCRCVQVPLTLQAPDPESGPRWFTRQETGLQKSVLGPAKFKAFTEGKVELKDLVGVRHSERWGVSRFEQSLSAILSRGE